MRISHFILLVAGAQACDFNKCLKDIITSPVWGGQAVKGYLQAAKAENPIKFATTSKEIVDKGIGLAEACSGCEFELYQDCDTKDSRKNTDPYSRNCGGMADKIQDPGERRCAQYHNVADGEHPGDIFWPPQTNTYLMHCDNKAFDFINGCFFPCQECGQCSGQKSDGAGTICTPDAPDADGSTALQGLTGEADHILTMPDEEGDPDPDENPEKRDLAAMISSLSLENRAVDPDADVKTPAAVFWKCKDKEFGYIASGDRQPDVWALVYNKDWLQISDLQIGLVPKEDVPKVVRANGKEETGTQYDHVLEGQALSQFFESDKAKYKPLLKALLKSDTELDTSKDQSSLDKYPNCHLKKIIKKMNGVGNIVPLYTPINHYKGVTLRGVYEGRESAQPDEKEPKNNKDMAIAGIFSYMIQITQMHDRTVELVADIMDEVPDVPKFGCDFKNFAYDKWSNGMNIIGSWAAKQETIKPLLVIDKVTQALPAIVKATEGTPTKRRKLGGGKRCGAAKMVRWTA